MSDTIPVLKNRISDLEKQLKEAKASKQKQEALARCIKLGVFTENGYAVFSKKDMDEHQVFVHRLMADATTANLFETLFVDSEEPIILSESNDAIVSYYLEMTGPTVNIMKNGKGVFKIEPFDAFHLNRVVFNTFIELLALTFPMDKWDGYSITRYVTPKNKMAFVGRGRKL